MIIKNTTHFTGEEAVEEISKYSKKVYYKKFIFPSILFVFGIIAVIIVAQQDNPANTFLLGALFILFAGILFLFNLFSLLTIKKRTCKKNPKLVEFGMKNEFTFKEESFTLHSSIGEETTKMEYPYMNIKKIEEYDTEILFWITDTSFYSCKKDAFPSEKELDVFFYGLEKHKIKIKKKLSKVKEIQ
ncbi:MAG: hypothetical protein K2N65_04225 [Anaeroplasmataceae bacterium]|nr:hypothetical protein [Anaeroplasmataceae bacterium]